MTNEVASVETPGPRPLRMVLIGESPSMPTGFGMQTQLLCESFATWGAEVFLLSASVPIKPVLMQGVTEWRYSNIHDIPQIDAMLASLQPDVCFVFGCTSFLAHFLQLRSTPPNCPTYYWLPYEGSVLPDEAKKQFRGAPANQVIHLSEFGRNLWKPLIDSDVVIPHCYDPNVWQFDENFSEDQQQQLRRKWAKVLKFPFFDDSFVVLNFDRNIWHKRWDATFDYIARLQKAMPDRPVQLIAHAKMNQISDSGGHPPGFNLPYLERKYGLHNQVCYTGFDWDAGLRREDLVELCRLSDVRITTSQGEGFGVPTVETAAIGKLQIINNQTTMPEIIGPGSRMLVDPAMTEDKMGSLWQVPNVVAMVERTLEFVNNPEIAEESTRAARERVEQQFTVQRVAKKLVDTFQTGINSTSRANLFYKYRWGYQRQHDMPKVWGDLGRAIALITSQGSVFEVGSFQGDFIEICMEFGLKCQGLESDAKALEKASTRSKMAIHQRKFGEDWPHSDCIVATDMHDRWFAEGGMEFLQNMLERVSFYEWACVRWLPVFKWGSTNVSPEVCQSMLQAKGMVRRHDLEAKLKTRFLNFEHEVWRRGGDMNFVPKALKEKKSDGSGCSGHN